MMFQYVLTEHEASSPDIGVYRTFGLMAVAPETGGEEVCCLADISTDRAYVSALAERFTSLQLHPLHLGDVLEDIL